MPTVVVNLLQSTGTKGGIEIYARELYSQMARMPSEFEWIGFASRELAAAGADWFPGELVDSGISGENRLTWARGELVAVSQFADDRRADLIHGPAMFGPLRSRARVVLSIHDVLYFSHPELMQTKLYTGPVKWMERRGVRNASRVITISEYSARGIREYLRVPSARIDVIPLAGRRFSVQPDSAAQRRTGLFLAIGQRSPYKDFATVVRAWSHIPERERPRLVITGSHGEDPLIPLVRELGLTDSIELREWVSTEELSAYYAEATALIDSTIATGFSLPTVEAMAQGLPVVLADSEVFREVGGDAAIYFAPADPQSLAAAIRRFKAEPDLSAELSRLGRERWSAYTWEDVARRTLESFRVALGGSRRMR